MLIKKEGIQPMSKYGTPENKITSDLAVEMLDMDIEQTNLESSTIMFPRLACKVNIYQDKIIFSRDGQEFGILMDSMVLRTQEIHDYYGNPNNRIPRCFNQK